MRINSIPKIALIGVLLICTGFIAIYLADINPLAKANQEGGELERLFDNLDVVRVRDNQTPIEIRLPDVNGMSVDLADYRGKIVFLNFWATWCPPCVAEMPSMEKLHQKFRNKDFAMVSISLQDNPAQVKDFFNKNKLTFTALLDSTGEIGAGFGLREIPTTLILDKAGRAIGIVMGPRQWESRKSIKLFEHLTDKYVASSTKDSQRR
ncbi:MAG: TlpA family protein disulfide reductase [Desulfobacterales bacterium]|nr:MAG: TlpA family protein disulfide reductase [Desulfobacterales bacterium]